MGNDFVQQNLEFYLIIVFTGRLLFYEIPATSLHLL